MELSNDEKLLIAILRQRQKVSDTPYKERRYSLCNTGGDSYCFNCYSGWPGVTGGCICPSCRCDHCSHY